MRVIIPVKSFAEAKQRLSPALNQRQRAHLAERMFRHVLGVAAAVFSAARVLVISRSQDALALAEAGGATPLAERTPSALNMALRQAADFVRTQGHSKILILASDLPLLEEDDLAEIAGNDCSIAPDRHNSGTNALLWPVDLSFQFGQASFARHRNIAETAGLVPTILVRKGLAHDVDLPADLIGLDL